MTFQNNRFEYSLALPEDAEQLLKIFESEDFKGDISVLYTRRPDPYQSLNLEGDKALIFKARHLETGIICALGCCVIRKAYLNGEVKKTCYLTGLKILPEYRRRLLKIADAYRFIHEQTQNDVDLYYTTILKDNIEAQRMLTKKHKNMPDYRYIGDYTVYSLGTGSRCNLAGYRFEKGNYKGIKEFYGPQLKNYNFAPLDPNLYGAGEKDFFAFRDNEGEIMAAALVWNQQSYKQYIITGYSGIYKIAKNLPMKWLGFPVFPKANSPANYGSIALFYVGNNDHEIAEAFLRKILECSKAYDFLMLGLFQGHPLEPAVKKIRHIKYQSKLYTVHWDDDHLMPDQRPLDLEVGLL